MPHFSGLLSDNEWEKLGTKEKLDTLREAIDEVFNSLVITGQQVGQRAQHVRRDVADDLEKVSQRIKAVEDRLGIKAKD
jgi:hypothetical protein